MLTPEQVNGYAVTVYAQNVERGWWDDPNRNIYQTLQLVNTEIAEATEGDRKNLMDDHLPHRKMVEVEMADAFIRLVDIAGRYGWDYYPEYQASRYLERVDGNLAGYHLVLTIQVGEIAKQLMFGPPSQGYMCYGYAISTLLEICRREGYDLQGAIDEKLEYNKTRADHDREARAHFDGKKY